MRILVTGSQNWTDAEKLYNALDKLIKDHDRNDVVLVHGACPRGADTMADEWAISRGVAREPHPAKWVVDGEFNRGAGYARNYDMVKLGADICVSFIRDGSFGSTHTARTAEKEGIKTVRYLA